MKRRRSMSKAIVQHEAMPLGDVWMMALVAAFISSFIFVSANKPAPQNFWISKHKGDTYLERDIHQAEQGDAEAQVVMARRYFDGDAVKQSDAEAVKWISRAAVAGNDDGQFLLAAGQMTEAANVKKDYASALQWARKGVARGDMKAQYIFYTAYFYGRGVKQDKAEALKWLQKSADQGFFAAVYELAEMYKRGEIVNQDDAKAFKLYRKAAAEGDVYGQYMTGEMYFEGRGVKQDKTAGLEWFHKVADQGDAGAQMSLGWICYKGKNYTQAFKWFYKAVDQGDASAFAAIGEMYDEGKGVRQDNIEAYKWGLLAVARNANYKNYLDLFAAKMTPMQIVEAKKRAAAWKPSKM
jgi:TPR repeat protein